MVQRMGGVRRKTRAKLRKEPRAHGKVSIRRVLEEFATGDRVFLVAEPAVQNGMYHPRFHGKAGVVQKMQGACCVVAVKDGGVRKSLIIHPVHLKRSG